MKIFLFFALAAALQEGTRPRVMDVLLAKEHPIEEVQNALKLLLAPHRSMYFFVISMSFLLHAASPGSRVL